MPPAHILNAPTKLMKNLGYGKGYEYDHEAEEGFSGQNYFPDGMAREQFYRPKETGFEREIPSGWIIGRSCGRRRAGRGELSFLNSSGVGEKWQRRISCERSSCFAQWCSLSAGCAETPHYSYPPPSEAPMAPQPARPAPVYVAPTPPPRPVKPLGVGALTAKNVGGYMDGEERELRADLRRSGVGISRPGDEITLYLRSDILFAPNSQHLTARSAQILSAIAAVLIKYDSTFLTVNGYSDTMGPPDRAIQLSQERADAVAQALKEAGIDARRIVTHGLGATHLKIPTGPNVSEPRNRRVEILIQPRMAG